MDVRREKSLNSHRSCGHVDERRSALLTGRVTVKIRLGTAALVVPRSGRRMAPSAVVPRSSTARPHRCPQGDGRPLPGSRRLSRARLGRGRGDRQAGFSTGARSDWRADCALYRHGAPGPPVSWLVSKPRILKAAALTPAFAGPYHRCFGAISAPGLCLPSTMTGLRESFP
jgi:hypothetical protein